MGAALLTISNISKRFSGVQALGGVDFNLYAGEVHALVGENGAGKSTLMKVIAGVHQPDTGRIVIDEKEVNFSNTDDSQKAGISMIYQELNLINTISIAGNIFLNREFKHGIFLNEKRMNEEAKKSLDQIGVKLDPRVKVSRLSMAQKQLVEIAKAISMEAKIIIMDEPTSSLTEGEKKYLFDIIAALKKKGVGIIYISHDLDDVFKLADRITVLRDGCTVTSSSTDSTNKASVINQMVGRELNQIYDFQTNVKPKVLLEVDGLSNKELLKDISFSVREGEILGIAGLVGAGRTELAYHLYGLMKPEVGMIKLRSKVVSIDSPSKAMSLGIGLVPEDRKDMGLFLNMPIQTNVSMSNLKSIRRGGLMHSKLERNKALQYIKDFKIRTSGPEKKVVELSGGNQQKVVLARTVDTKPQLLIFDEPTRGVDVGAKSEIYKLMYKLASTGVAIIMISSELPEVLGVCDRILVMRGGTIAGELSREEANSELVMQYATGQK
ncbi:sugar ABC transporter ATP-binding protein [Paenibacillus sp. BSR1-1]|uniref:sugar ABC transporter ATP-binding protein n=1 Tax=Paenibacillus sp. BSR1-1 TaxID=3020845 RepID=UPI0025B0F5E8|nr:sugar ABC transporter ATP-binding protein [Paenibacillus sp. BSR1-1]MDN3019421.1 sugar ABC transporter ATP-binding protein [Paenibacillus sp. BSR1-1]